MAALDTGGRLSFHLPSLRTAAGFATDGARRELLRRLGELPGMTPRLDVDASYPGGDVDALQGPTALRRLRDLLDWIGAQLASGGGPGAPGATGIQADDGGAVAGAPPAAEPP